MCSSKTILLTGATGFIGRNVLTLLCKRGDRVVAFGRRPPPQVDGAGLVRWISGDLATGQGLGSVDWRTIDAVIHLAAAGVKASARAWPQTLAVNVTGTQRLLQAIQASGQTPAIFLARTFYERFVDQAPALLDNPYIATKAAASELGRLFASTYVGRVVFGVFFQVYGPGDDAGNVLSYAAREFKSRRQAVFGSGRGMRDWIYVEDAARAVIASVHASPGSRVTEYDIGAGQLVSIREMVERFHRLFPDTPAPVFEPARDRPDVSLVAKAEALPPQWTPAHSVEAGLLQLFQSI